MKSMIGNEEPDRKEEYDREGRIRQEKEYDVKEEQDREKEYDREGRTGMEGVCYERKIKTGRKSMIGNEKQDSEEEYDRKGRARQR